MAAKKKKQKPVWERGYNGHVYWLGKRKLGKVTLQAREARHRYTWDAGGRAGAADDLVAAKRAVEMHVEMADKQLDLFP